MNAIFADSFYYLAWLNVNDSAHSKALELANVSAATVVTTEYVLMEVGDALAESHYRNRLEQFIHSLRADSATIVVDASPQLFNQGMGLYSNRHDKGWSMTDWISFVVMRERAVIDALTADHHFVQAGFHLLF